MKKLWFLLVLLVAVPAEAVDIRSFSDNPAPASVDLLYCVDDPTGTPADCKVTIGTLFSNIPNDAVDAGAIDGSLSETWSGTHTFSSGDIIVPQNTDCSTYTAEGQLCWDSDNDTLYLGDGAAASVIAGGSGTGVTVTTVGSLGACTGSEDGEVKVVTDGDDAGDCTVGSGSTYNICVCNTSAWSDTHDSTGSALGANLSSSGNQILSDTGILSFGDDDVITSGTMQAAGFRVTGSEVSTINDLEVTGSFRLPYKSNCGVEENGDICISTGISDLPATQVHWGGQVMYNLSIKQTDFTPIDGYAIAYSSADNGFTMQEVAIERLSQTGDVITFNDVDYDFGIGGTDLGTSDIVLLSTGGATFNEQGVNSDFRVESDTNDQAFFIEGSDGYVGINQNAPSEQLTINGTLKLEGTGSAHATYGAVSADCCVAAGTGECANGSQFYSSAGKFCYCNGSGVDLFIVDDSTCTY